MPNWNTPSTAAPLTYGKFLNFFNNNTNFLPNFLWLFLRKKIHKFYDITHSLYNPISRLDILPPLHTSVDFFFFAYLSLSLECLLVYLSLEVINPQCVWIPYTSNFQSNFSFISIFRSLFPIHHFCYHNIWLY